MPLSSAARESFSRRFSPLDPFALLPGDADALREWLLGARILEHREVNAAFVIPLRGVCTYRILKGSERRSWNRRIEALELLDASFWIVASAGVPSDEPLRKAAIARKVAIDAHQWLTERPRGHSYGRLRQDRRRAWHTFLRTAEPAFLRGLDAYVLLICSRT